ncbi:hypothetical protein ACFLTU_05340 [Bacteroidota bacterium]
MKKLVFALSMILALTKCTSDKEKLAWTDDIQVVLDNTTALEYDRGARLPLYLWPTTGNWDLSPIAAEELVKELDKRGVGLVSSWNSKDSSTRISQCLTVAHAQKKLGQRINIEATDLMNYFFNGDEATAHIDQEGNSFFDDSFGKHKMGCPFAIDFRKKEIRDRFVFFLKKYEDEGLSVDFIFTDWEIDGPLEVNRAFEASKKCTRCCESLGDDFTYEEFQKQLREMRSYLQYYSYSEPVLDQSPDALVGNYAVYPNDGFRYWYDYFEFYVEGQPYKADQQAKYRKWYDDFPATGYTFAMPVSYTWDPSYSWYDFDNSDYRWFYNMLLVASNAGKSTPPSIPIISFVHWNTVFVTGEVDPAVKQMSKNSYQELLWHMLLRGTDTFYLWARRSEFPEEVRLLHEVYAAAQEFGDFLEHGQPIIFDVPNSPGAVISGLMMGDSLLIRRTDFSANHEDVEIMAGTKVLTVEYAPGICKIITLEDL